MCLFMDSLSKTYLNKNFDLSCKACDENAIALKCGNTNSVLIPQGTLVGTSYTVSSINVKSTNSTLIEFASNITTTNFAGTINFQVFKLCCNQFIPIPVGPAWTFLIPAANNSSDAFSFFIHDCNANLDKFCTYTIGVTITNSNTLLITNVGNTNPGSMSIFSENGNSFFFSYKLNGVIGFSGIIGGVIFLDVLGIVSIFNASGTVTFNNNTVTIDKNNASYTITLHDTLGDTYEIYVSSPPDSVTNITIAPVYGTVSQGSYTTGTCNINNAALTAFSV